jgi:L-amino acid N-acyltransferase YncA
MTELTNNDYKQILEYYNKTIPKSNRLLKRNAEQILAEKLCKCIKKIEPENEARSIGICTKTIFNRKGYTRGKFKCRGKRTVTVKKTIKRRN